MGLDIQALREKALQADDLIYEDIEVPEWGGKYPIRSLSGKALKTVMEKSKVGRSGERDDMRLVLLAALLGCVDRAGNRVFRDEDLAVFEGDNKSAAPLLRIGRRVLELSQNEEGAIAETKN